MRGRLAALAVLVTALIAAAPAVAHRSKSTTAPFGFEWPGWGWEVRFVRRAFVRTPGSMLRYRSFAL